MKVGGIFLAIFLLGVFRVCAYQNACSYIKPSGSISFDIIDLSHPLGPPTGTKMLGFAFNHTVDFKGIDKRFNIWNERYLLSMSEHTGTHVDAPSHMNRNGPEMHEIPDNHLMGPAVIIDVRDKVKFNEMYAVTIEDLYKWESRFGRIPDGAVVVMNSEWYKRYPDPYALFNTQNLNDLKSFRFPYWSNEAIDWLLRHRRVIAVGGDTAGVDILNGKFLPVHDKLFRRCVLALEGVSNLDKVPESGSLIVIPALKIYGGSGSPARMLAFVPKLNKLIYILE